MSSTNGVMPKFISLNGCKLGPPTESDEQVVISGIAGRFPECRTVADLKDALMNKKDLITTDDRRWNLEHEEIPRPSGKIDGMTKFDAHFFGIPTKQCHCMDPMSRVLLEHAYEAVIDAGINPRKLRGTNTAVIIGTCFSESEKTFYYEKLQVSGLGITGCSRAMLANRLSYFLGLQGPSYTIDSACSSSLVAIDAAYKMIISGQCDAAIVGGCNLCLHPYVTLQFFRLGVLSPDGHCKSFDDAADGYVRSETIAVVYLQKARDAKRVYASIVYTKTNSDGYKSQGLLFPSRETQARLMHDFYNECDMSPNCLSFLEAHATGTAAGDPEELGAIEEVFCQNRTTPLRIGSVKSNLGHTEPASGLCSMAKVIISMETGLIAPNLNYTTPRTGIEALSDGRLEVITEPTPWEGGFAGINSFGFGGVNTHVLVKSFEKEKINGGEPLDNLPRLLVVSGRTEEGVYELLRSAETTPIDAEYIGLLQDIHSSDVSGHIYRGYSVLHKETSNPPIREIQNYSGLKRPIWFAFSGMGSQWPGMGTDLMQLPIFANAIKKCDNVLKPLGLDIVDIITNKDPKTFDNILNSFVGIAAVQIGLLDILNVLGIQPDNIIGHSVGELGCAYADGCLTAEQMVLTAYYRGIASIETELIYGAMAAIGLGQKDLQPMCPADIDISCHNSATSCTISGPAESVQEFVSKLQANKIFAKEVQCSNIPYHSRYISDAGPILLKYLKKVIPDQKLRSEKWLSTSVPRENWSTDEAKYSSAEYYTNNLLSYVLFEETAQLIPENAVVVEIAPHGLLQAILKRSLHQGVVNVPLTLRNSNDNLDFFLRAIGKLYNAGAQPDVPKLYPAIQYPVSRGTQMISPYIKWQHSQDWYLASYVVNEKQTTAERVFEVSLNDENFEYLVGHVVDGRTLIAGAGYLICIWESFSRIRGKLRDEVSVVFEDVRFERATSIPKDGGVDILTLIHTGSGKFEVCQGDSTVVTGIIRTLENRATEMISSEFTPEFEEEEPLTVKDIYKEFRLRGYEFEGLFRSVKSASLSGNKAHISWAGNWATFIDGMIQLGLLGEDVKALCVPTSIQKLVIDTSQHLEMLRNISSEEKELPAYKYKHLELVKCGGVELRGPSAFEIARRKITAVPVLEKYQFVPYFDKAQTTLQEMMVLVANLFLENKIQYMISTVEFVDDAYNIEGEELLSPFLANAFSDLPLIQVVSTLYTTSERYKEMQLPPTVTQIDLKTKRFPTEAINQIAIGYNLLSVSENKVLNLIMRSMTPEAFLISRETSLSEDTFEQIKKHNLQVIMEKKFGDDTFLVLRKQMAPPTKIEVVHVRNDEFGWLDKVKSTVESLEETPNQKITMILVGQGDPYCGLLGFSNCLFKEPSGNVIRTVLIQDQNAPEFSLENPLYANQLELNLAVNVLRDGNVWGSYKHLPLPKPQPVPVYHSICMQKVRGDLSSFTWCEGPITPDDKKVCNIIYGSLNFRDIMFATSKLSLSAEMLATMPRTVTKCLGFEYSGFDQSGRRIMGFSLNGAVTNKTIMEEYLSWPVPDSWSLQDAATIPSVYITTLYALYTCGNMKKGDKVLIHAGSGAVGQAAINLALYTGCEVFTTVGTQEKRDFIKKTYPSIDDNHIGNSRNTSFEQLIMEQTNGTGVDIVLNSLADEKLLASVRCLGLNGRFLEIGKADLVNNSALALKPFLKQISFQSIMIDTTVFAMPGKVGERKKELSMLLTKYIKAGAVKPLTWTCFEKEQVETAVRYMASGKHIGKVIIKIQDESSISTKKLALPSFYGEPKKSYVIIGGLGGLGLELTDWLIIRGARNIVLVSRGGVKNGYQQLRLEMWKKYNAKVVIIAGKDASIDEDCEYILKTAEKMAPVAGIFNLAAVLKDALCISQTADTFETSMKPKARTTEKLDKLSRKLCPKLKHFVVFSSVSCGRGTPGQTNYGMSNSVMERICEQRVKDGFPALAIEWGAVAEVGLVAEMQADRKELVISGTLQQKLVSCLQELNYFLRQTDAVIVSSMVVAEKSLTGAEFSTIRGTVLHIIGLADCADISPHTRLSEMGMDSMMAIEIKQSLEQNYGVYLTTKDLRELTLAKLTEMSEAAESSVKKQDDTANEIDPSEMTGIKLFIRTMTKVVANPEVCVELPVITSKMDLTNEILIIPGVEGVASVFSDLIPNLRNPTTCLQLGMDETKQHITELADYLLPHILERNKNKKNFAIVGYSYGALIAIEIVRRLEALNLTGRLVLIDGTPSLMHNVIQNFFNVTSRNDFENLLLSYLVDIVNPTYTAEVHLVTTKYNNWEEKLDAILSLVPSEEIRLPITYVKALFTAIYHRIHNITQYTNSPLPPIKTPITLLVPTSPIIGFPKIEYNVDKITAGKTVVHEITGNHFTILNNEDTAKHIMQEFYGGEDIQKASKLNPNIVPTTQSDIATR